jgi:FtsH-binding integral membrane protein
MIYINGGLKKYMVSVFNKMFFALCLTGVVSLVCSSNPDILAFMASGFSFILMLATVGIVIYMSARINKMDSEKANALFWIYSALIGAAFSPLFAMYTGESIANAFFSTAVFFGGMSLYGYATNRDLTGVGSFMTVGLFAIIITSLANVIFMKSSGLQLGLSALSIIVFCGLTAYDVQKIKEFYSDSLDEETLKKRGVFGALNLYMDFLNIFIALLRLVGNRKQ